jgi:flagellar biosynthesis protein FliP
MAELVRKWSMRGTMVLVAALVVLMLSGSARGQATGSGNGAYGPPTAEGWREQQIRNLLGNTGLPASLPAAGGAVAGATGGTQSEAVALPDLTRTIPTTTEPAKLSNSLQILLLLSVLTLAPSILLMTTCFTRIVIVMSLLRQALGAAQLPPNQVLIGLSLFMTFLVMAPTWNRINSEAIQPYSANQISQFEAFDRAKNVLREFMIKQVEAAHNEDDVYLFHSYEHPNAAAPQTWEEVSTTTLVPAFILSELKVAFLMGFRIYLPFLDHRHGDQFGADQHRDAAPAAGDGIAAVQAAAVCAGRWLAPGGGGAAGLVQLGDC